MQKQFDLEISAHFCAWQTELIRNNRTRNEKKHTMARKSDTPYNYIEEMRMRDEYWWGMGSTQRIEREWRYSLQCAMHKTSTQLKSLNYLQFRASRNTLDCFGWLHRMYLFIFLLPLYLFPYHLLLLSPEFSCFPHASVARVLSENQLHKTVW